MKRHITILISPDGEEFFACYDCPGMTKDRTKAMEYFTNENTTQSPWIFGRSRNGFWESERRAAEIARKQYAGWDYRHEPIESTEAA